MSGDLVECPAVAQEDSMAKTALKMAIGFVFVAGFLGITVSLVGGSMYVEDKIAEARNQHREDAEKRTGSAGDTIYCVGDDGISHEWVLAGPLYGDWTSGPVAFRDRKGFMVVLTPTCAFAERAPV